jgi:predicted RNase H-like HicB family nuclease
VQYTIIVEHDPEVNAYSVVVPALPGCTSQGATLDEAIANAREAIAGHVACLVEIGETVPPDTGAQAIRIEVAA